MPPAPMADSISYGPRRVPDARDIAPSRRTWTATDPPPRKAPAGPPKPPAEAENGRIEARAASTLSHDCSARERDCRSRRGVSGRSDLQKTPEQAHPRETGGGRRSFSKSRGVHPPCGFDSLLRHHVFNTIARRAPSSGRPRSSSRRRCGPKAGRTARSAVSEKLEVVPSLARHCCHARAQSLDYCGLTRIDVMQSFHVSCPQ